MGLLLFMNIQFIFKLILTFLLLISASNSFATPDKNIKNQSIGSDTRGEVVKIEKMLRTIKKKSSRSKFVRFTPRKKSIRRKHTNVLKVTATAYTSHVAQTDSTPNIAAWGDKLTPGMKAIAVSRDLLHVYGLKHGTKVRIKGLSGEYLVLDKMNKRWRKKIDIYMGKDRRKAFKWGRRRVELRWSL